MRALLDANIFISFLLPSQRATSITEIVEAGLAGEFTLLITSALLEELARRVRTKHYLAARISMEKLQDLVDLLAESSDEIPEIVESIPAISRDRKDDVTTQLPSWIVDAESIPAISRDRKDDYLLAYSAVGEADYLVTGDDELLSLREVEGIKIVTPSEFLAILTQQR
ncbi:MAG: PIN domain-containing protein [Chloroflexota bacterium]|nr:PIN domain-containing protein [Chloroflexota bacterium]